MARTALVTARGHAQIRATHAKTLEITGEPVISERATCVVGVGARWMPTDLAMLRGEVELTIEAGGQLATGRAVINPGHRIGQRMVLRRSQHVDADTLAVAATLTADSLTPELVQTLAKPGTTVLLRLVETSTPAPLVVVADPSSGVLDGRIGTLWRNADFTIDLADPRLSTLEPGMIAAGRVTGGDIGPVAGADRLRVAMPGDRAGEALLAAGMASTPALRLGELTARAARTPEVAGLLRTAPVPTVLFTDDLAAALAPLTAISPRHPVAVPDGNIDVGTRMVWRAAETATGSGVAVVAARPAHDVLDGENVVRALAAAGVSARTMSEALAPFGFPRKRIYPLLDAEKSNAEKLTAETVGAPDADRRR